MAPKAAKYHDFLENELFSATAAPDAGVLRRGLLRPPRELLRPLTGDVGLPWGVPEGAMFENSSGYLSFCFFESAKNDRTSDRFAP